MAKKVFKLTVEQIEFGNNGTAFDWLAVDGFIVGYQEFLDVLAYVEKKVGKHAHLLRQSCRYYAIDRKKFYCCTGTLRAFQKYCTIKIQFKHKGIENNVRFFYEERDGKYIDLYLDGVATFKSVAKGFVAVSNNEEAERLLDVPEAHDTNHPYHEVLSLTCVKIMKYKAA